MARLKLPCLNGITTPGFHHRSLVNGIPVGYIPLPETGLTCLDLWVAAGSRWETATETGLAHFLEHMVFKGSRRLAEGEFDWRIETIGGTSNAATGLDDVHFQVSCPAAAAMEALELVTELVLFPSFRDEAFALERLVVQEELKQALDQPDEVAYQALLAWACGSHSYGRPILGTPASLNALTVDAMAAFHQRLYGAGRLAVVVSGAVAPDVFHEQLRSNPLSRRAAVSPPRGLQPRLTVQPGHGRLKLKRLECARLMACWAMPPAAGHTMLAGVELAICLLAEGRCSWLISRLREELGLVDELDLEIIPLEAGSLAILEASCAPTQLHRLERLLPQCLTDWLRQPPRPQALQRACRQMATRLCFGMESAGGAAAHLGPSLLRGHVHPPDGPLADLQTWTATTLHTQVMPLFAPRQAHWLSVVPADNRS
ncbi:MAG: insulinase family protein [Synechococcus sp. SB0665_bin_28]|nr:insulinase family protein [Synechococcus sp. SB0665_bin_28]MYF19475.1 insulinase family protein [Synechococcus sp. SB0677_bin_5]